MAPKKPFLIKHDAASPASLLPAAAKWFLKDYDVKPPQSAPVSSLSTYMTDFGDWPFPYELFTTGTENEKTLVVFRDWLLSTNQMMDQLLAGFLEPIVSEADEQRFFQFQAPLHMLIRALDFNRSHYPHAKPLQLYIAQSSLSDLPPVIQGDLPIPEFVSQGGKGDIYGSSIWLGTEPTYTPLHRDPNPNLFCQLCSHKRVRLLPPTVGEQLFFTVQAALRRQAGSSRMRTAEMMEGVEREALHDAVWEGEDAPEEMREAELSPGDALFIPQGWWHAVKSKQAEGQLNGSVNWWFR